MPEQMDGQKKIGQSHWEPCYLVKHWKLIPDSEEDATNYFELKNTLLKRYNLTTVGYHGKFRKGRPKTEESVDQFIFRIKTYLEKWVELADVEATFEGVKNLLIKEQAIEACPRDLSINSFTGKKFANIS